MTSLLLAGYLAVCNGRRIASENPSTKKTTNHMYYDTLIQTMGVDIPAEIRNWVPASEAPLPDGTIVDILAKLHAPANSKAWLDVVQINAFPGDPNSASYEEGIPERPFPTIFVLGNTCGAAETMDDGLSTGYLVATSEYVRDQTRASRVYCRFDGTKARWKKTPRPSSGVSVYIVGLAYGLHLAGGHLIVDVDQLQLNVGMPTASASPQRIETGGTGAAPAAKRRRFPSSMASSNTAESGATASSNRDATAIEATVLDQNAANAGTTSPTTPTTPMSDEPVASGSRVRRVGTRRKKEGDE